MIWMQIAQLATTVVIGLIAALIAWRQWRTARDKLKLDLFDRRLAVFMDVRKVVSEVTQIGKFSDLGLPNEIWSRSQFLFGPEIRAEITKFHDLCMDFGMRDPTASDSLDAWFKKFSKMVEPYMQFGAIKS